MDTPNKRRRHNEESLRSRASSGENGKNSNPVENGENFNSVKNSKNSKSVVDAPETSLSIVAVPVSLEDGENHVTDIDDLQNNTEKDIVPNSAPKVPFRSVQQSSNYHGVTRHRTTGRFEASLWDKSLKNEGKSRKGKQVYLGVYDTEEKAAKAYDLTALKYFGPSAAKLNFPISDYEKQLEEMKDMTRDEFVCSIRRKSTCFSRGTSIYRGVTRHRREGSKWQARIGRLTGTKELHLGSFDTEEEAAIAYDLAAVELRGLKAVTNFDISNYIKGNPQLTEEFNKLKEIAQAKNKQANQA